MALKLHYKKLYAFVFLFASAVVGVAWLRYGAGHPPELLLSIVAVITGFFYFLYRQHLDETKLFRDLFVEFNSRYDKLNDALNMIVVSPSENSLTAAEEEFVIRYFNLCAEEYFFYHAGYIDSSVWQTWNRGMRIFFRNPRIARLWERERSTDSYYGFRPLT